MTEHIIVKKPPKSPFLAGLLSCFPGAGALYNGEYVKGIIYILAFAGLVTMQERAGGQPFLGLLLAGFIIFQFIDSINVAKAINRKAMLGENGESIKTLEEQIPQAVKTGSIFWGIVLLALGVIFLLGNFDIIDPHHIFDYWPLVIIAIGVKLVIDSISRKKKE